MSDLAYFQALYASALDFTMQAHWGAQIQSLNAGVLGPCVHSRSCMRSETSYGTHYTWEMCEDCGTEFDHRSRTGW